MTTDRESSNALVLEAMHVLQHMTEAEALAALGASDDPWIRAAIRRAGENSVKPPAVWLGACMIQMLVQGKQTLWPVLPAVLGERVVVLTYRPVNPDHDTAWFFYSGSIMPSEGVDPFDKAREMIEKGQPVANREGGAPWVGLSTSTPRRSRTRA